MTRISSIPASISVDSHYGHGTTMQLNITLPLGDASAIEPRTAATAAAAMANFLIRGIDPALWREVRVQAAMEGQSARAVILRLLRAYVTRRARADAKRSAP